MKTLWMILALLTGVLCFVLMTFIIIQDIEPDTDTLTQRFEGTLFHVVYYAAQDVWVLTFADGRIIKVSQQPREGWLLARSYEIIVTPSGVNISLMKELQNEKSQEDQKSLYPGKAF